MRHARGVDVRNRPGRAPVARDGVAPTTAPAQTQQVGAAQTQPVVVDAELPQQRDPRVAAGAAHGTGKALAGSPRGVHLTAWRERRVEGLRVVDGVNPADVLATRYADKSFRPTLVGRMDTSPAKLALVERFLAGLCDRHEGDAAIVGSSTTAPGSPDLLVNELAGRAGVPMVRFNFVDYLVAGDRLTDGARPDHVVDAQAKKAFLQAPHFTVPTGAAYGEALATVSNVAVVMGGRADALRELKNAVDAGPAVIALVVPGHEDSGHAWDAARVVDGKPAPRTDDAVGYLREQLRALDEGRPLHPDFGGITREWLTTNRASIDALVRFVELRDPVDAAVAAADAHVAQVQSLGS